MVIFGTQLMKLLKFKDMKSIKFTFNNKRRLEYLLPLPAILLMIFRNEFLKNSLIIYVSQLIVLRPQDLLIVLSVLPFWFLGKRMIIITLFILVGYYYGSR